MSRRKRGEPSIADLVAERLSTTEIVKRLGVNRNSVFQVRSRLRKVAPIPDERVDNGRGPKHCSFCHERGHYDSMRRPCPRRPRR